MSLGQTQAAAPWRERSKEILGISRLSESARVALLVLCAALPYANTLLNDFIFTYDDGTQILRNPYVHSFRYLRQIFATNVWSYLGSNTVTNYYRPVMMLGYLLCYKIFGPVAYGFHLASLVLHCAVVAVLFWVTRRMTSDSLLAFAAAALFALHPVHTEPVAWISGVTELEVTFFCLITFWLFLEVPRPGGGSSELVKLGMAACYVPALLSKEQALVLPLLAALYEHLYREDRHLTTGRQKLSRYGVLWLAGAAYMLFRFRFLGGFAPLLQRPRLTWPEAFLAAIALLGRYFWKLIWPAHLSFYYLFPEEIGSLVPWMIVGSAALTVCAWLFHTLWKRQRLASFGLLWLLATLLPVLNARWMARNVFAERYLYLPSVGFCWLLAWGLTGWWRLTLTRPAAWRAAFLGVVGVISALCVLRIVTRNRDWRDDVALYRRTLAVSPDAYVVRSALGLAYWIQGNGEAAEQEWRVALRLAPNDPAAWNYLGTACARKKEFPTAIRCFERALELDPASADAHLNLGAAYAEMGVMPSAEVQFRAAVALSPLSVQAHNVLGKLYLDLGQSREAVQQFLESLGIEPNVPAYDHLGYLYLRCGDRDRAEQAFKGALALNAAESRAHFNLGAIYAETGRPDQAVREYVAGLKSEPDNQEALEALRKLRERVQGLQPSQP